MKPSLIFLFPLPFIHNLSQVPRLFPWEHFQLEFLCQAAEFNPGCTHQPTWEGAAFLCSHSTSVLHTTSRTTSSTAVFFMPFLAQPPLFNLTLSLSPLPHHCPFTNNQFSDMDGLHVLFTYSLSKYVSKNWQHQTRLLEKHSGYSVKLPRGGCDKRSHWGCLLGASEVALEGDDEGLSSGDGVI